MGSPTQAPLRAPTARDGRRGTPRRLATAIAVATILALALGLRLAYASHTAEQRPRNDAASYDAIAAAIGAGQGYPSGHRRDAGERRVTVPRAYRPPGYPFALGGVYALSSTRAPGRWAAARVFQAILGVVTVVLVGVLARQLWGGRAGLVALALAAVYVPLIVVGGALISESLFVALILGATACTAALTHSERRWPWAVAAGLLAGLAALTRQNGVVLVVAVAVGAALAGTARWRRRGVAAGAHGRTRRRRGLAAGATIVAVAVIAIAPWTIRNALAFGSFVPISTETGNTLAGTYNERSRTQTRDPAAWHTLHQSRTYTAYIKRARREHVPAPQVDAHLTSAALDFIGRHPLYLAEVGYWNTVRLADLAGLPRARFTAATIGVRADFADAGTICFWVVGALALLGLLSARLRRGPRWVWLVPLALFASEVFVSTETPRFRAPLDPFVILLAALALIAAWDRVTGRRRAESPSAASGARPGPRVRRIVRLRSRATHRAAFRLPDRR